MIIVVAALEFADENARNRAAAACAATQLATREEETGCVDYCFAPDPAIQTRIQVYELWQDSASLAAHFQHANYRKMVKILGDAGVLTSVNRAYLTEQDEPVYGPNGEMKTAYFEN